MEGTHAPQGGGGMNGCNPPWAHPTAQRRCRWLRRPRAHYGEREGPAARRPETQGTPNQTTPCRLVVPNASKWMIKLEGAPR